MIWSLSSIPLADVIADSWALGLKQDARFRNNAGAVNTSANARTFTITVKAVASRGQLGKSLPHHRHRVE